MVALSMTWIFLLREGNVEISKQESELIDSQFRQYGDEEVRRRIKKEIADDPTGRGYAGKTDAQITVLMNEPYLVDGPDKGEVVINGRGEKENVIVKTKMVAPSRLHEISIGLPFVANVSSDVVVRESKLIKEE